MGESRRKVLGGIAIIGGYLFFRDSDGSWGGGIGAPDSVDIDVETIEAKTVDWEGATLVGELLELEGATAADGYFEVWEVGSDELLETIDDSVSETGEFYRAINGLDPETNYEAIAVAAVNDTIAEGDIIEFATEAEPAIEVVTTDTVDEIGEEQARLSGEVVDMTNTSEADAYFEYRPKTDEERQDSEIVVVSEPQTYDVLIEGLEPATEYEGRAKAVATDRDDVVDYGKFVNWETTGTAIPDSAIAHYDVQSAFGSGDDGTTISTLPDELGNYDLTGSDPTVQSSGVNSNRSLLFDANDDLLSNSNLPLNRPVTIFVVIKNNHSGDTGGYANRLYAGDGAGLHADLDRSGTFVMADHSAGVTLDTGFETTNPTILTHVWDTDSTSEYRINGATQATGDAGSTDATGLAVGANYGGGGNYYDGYLGELVPCDGVLTQSEIDQEEQRLADRWGITLS